MSDFEKPDAKKERVLPLPTPEKPRAAEITSITPEEKAATDEAARLEATEKRGRAIEDETVIQDALDKVNGGPTRPFRQEAPQKEPTGLSTAEVKTKEDFRKTMDIVKTVFTDPTDLDSNRSMSRFFFSPEIARYYMIQDGEKPIGFELIRLNPNIPDAMYVPYAGLLSDYRNMGIYPKAARISDEQMREHGKDHVLYEFEDPNRIIQANAYTDEKREDVVRRCEGRINFWKRSVNCHVVNDQDVPYCRPASDDSQKIQAYDVLAFRALDDNDPKWKDAFNEDKTAISRDAYEKFYLEIMQLEYGSKEGVPSKEELRKGYPAIDQFFKQMEAHPDKQWVSIDSGKVRRKETPSVEKPVEARVGQTDERDRWKNVPNKGSGWEEPLRKEAA